MQEKADNTELVRLGGRSVNYHTYIIYTVVNSLFLATLLCLLKKREREREMPCLLHLGKYYDLSLTKRVA